jgi:hypothetical protein
MRHSVLTDARSNRQTKLCEIFAKVSVLANSREDGAKWVFLSASLMIFRLPARTDSIKDHHDYKLSVDAIAV